MADKTWMPGTSPGMTERQAPNFPSPSIIQRVVAKHRLPEARGQDAAVSRRHHEGQGLGIDLDLRKRRSPALMREVAELGNFGHRADDARRADAASRGDGGEVDAEGGGGLLHA